LPPGIDSVSEGDGLAGTVEAVAGKVGKPDGDGDVGKPDGDGGGVAETLG